MKTVTHNSCIETEIICSPDNKNTYCITKRLKGVEGETGIIVMLFPTRNADNMNADDSTLNHIVAHLGDFGFNEVKIINLFSKVVNARISARGLEVDSENLKKELPEVDENEQEEFLLSMGIAKEKDNFKLEHNQFSKFASDYIQVVLKGNQKELSIYNFKKGVYENEYVEETLGKIIKYLLNYITDLWNPSWEDLIIKTLKRDTHTVVNNFNNGEFVNLKDGILDLETFELKEHSPQYYSTIQLPIEYKKSTTTTVFSKFLDDITCSDDELKTILQEIVGYCLCNSTKAEKAFFFVGNGCNGKSVLAKIIQLLVGESNYSNTTLSALSGNFGLASLINSNVNIAAENNNGKLNSEIFKAVVSGDTVEINRKYRDAISVPLHTKLIFLFNELPDNGDLTHGFFRKIIIIPFNKTFKGAEIDVDMYSKLEKEISGIFQWAIEGLKCLKENDYKFSSCSASDKCLENYKRELNPVADFFDTHFKLDSNQQIKRSEIYNRYQECYSHSYESAQKNAAMKLDETIENIRKTG